QEAQPCLWVSHTALHELQVGEVLLSVGVEEALGVVTGVREGLVHLLIEVAAFVGGFHGQAVAVDRVDDAAGGDLRLEQADAVVLDDEILRHGLEEGDLVTCVGILVAGDSSLSRQHLVVQLWPDHALSHRLVHRQPRVPHGVDDETGGSLSLQEHQRRARADQLLLHGLIDAHLLVGGFDQQPSDAALALQVLLDVLPLRELVHAHNTLHQLVQALPAQNAGVSQLLRRHLLPDAVE
ncbi:hypothetical protein N310_05437, partial [Acanthisitta chloris]